MRAAFAWFRLALFVVVLVVSVVMKRWILVAISGACIALVIFRAIRARPRTQASVVVPRPPDVGTSQPAADSDEPSESPEFELNPATVEAIRSRGGSLYIWADEAGLFRASALAPDEAISFDQFFLDSCSIYVDRGISRDSPLLIRWKRLLWPHFSVVYDLRAGKGIIDAIFDWNWGGPPS